MMSQNLKLSDKFHEVLKHEGVVSIMSWGVEPHMVNTWNSFVVITEDERILIPAYGFRRTEKNVEANNQIKLSIGSKNVLGHKDTTRELVLLLQEQPTTSIRVPNMI